MSEPIWKPGEERTSRSNLACFMAGVRSKHNAELNDYSDLYRWSIEHPEQFWPEVWDTFGVRASKRWDEVLIDGDRMPGAKWFTGSRLNFAENLLRFRDERTALWFRGEQGHDVRYSYGELYEAVARVAAGLKAAGVGVGDRVAAFMPNRPETVIAMLATTSLGAIWSSCSPDFGINGVLDRFGQIEPTVLFTADGYFYNGKTIDSLGRVRDILGKLPSVKQVVVVPYVDESPDTRGLPRPALFADFGEATDEIEFAQLPFDHPIYIMYSSGTTGVPKCIVHGAGGVLLQHLKELALHTDLKRDDKIFYFTTCGWMMWNWLVSSLALGATVVLYDGSPFHPQPNSLLKLADEIGITIFGTSAKYIAALEKAGVKSGNGFTLDALKAILSTGSPLAQESFDYVYRDLKQDVQLSSISGGTDIVSCFALGNPILPVWRGELQCRGLGMAVEIFNEDGQPVRNEKGELVCVKPFPVMPVQFWNDPDGKRYRGAYFERFPGVWCHGDYAELTEHDGVIIYGRSDAVLNPGGVRIGTAEIYRQVEKLDEVLESIAVGQEWDDDTRVVLFVKLRSGVELDDELRARIRKIIRDNTSPRHVPAKIIAVADIPRTISGKIVELAVTHVIHGRPVKNTDALANPEALALYRNLPELDTD
ncbi:MAG TPA: acetoacetate--CoA ligase [Gammaproteobacteria bacterium]|nr:acetoacetate--CoA ligase [Gammaproteobacteria bacterium]